LTNNISDKDKKDWKNFILKNEKLINKDLNQNEKKIYKIKSIDLHGYSLEEANILIEKTINESYNSGISKLIVITGKGLHSQNEKNPYVSKELSILKYSIPEFIQNNKKLSKLIIEIKDAKIEDGGSGAFYIFLKKNNSK
jgi:DNA-nicking Smr family endonuclease|tara:strand:+ start:552 stop:971 length:420 start_codon:yes stop_codon:yes gene_type:complete